MRSRSSETVPLTVWSSRATILIFTFGSLSLDCRLVAAYFANSTESYDDPSTAESYHDSSINAMSVPDETSANETLAYDRSSESSPADNNLTSDVCRAQYSCLSTAGRAAGCSCHSYCFLFNDCCADATKAPEANGTASLPPEAYTCIDTETYASYVHVIIKCPTPYSNDAISKQCSRPLPASNDGAHADSLSTPITDRRTGITYRNVFCAVCWNVPTETLQSWSWQFRCRESYSSFSTSEQMTTLSKGVRQMDGTTTGQAIYLLDYIRQHCALRYSPPPSLLRTMKQCTPNLIVECTNGTAADDSPVAQCQHGPAMYVYYRGQAYRNEYCAVCNNNNDPAIHWTCFYEVEVDVVQTWQFSLLVTPGSDKCLNTGNTPKTAGITVENLCRSIVGCTSNQLDICQDICPPGLVFEYERCRPPNSSSPCSFSSDIGTASRTKAYWSYFVNDTLVLQSNETSTLCFSCNATVFLNYTHIKDSIIVSVDGANITYRRPLFVLEDGRAKICTSVRNNSFGYQRKALGTASDCDSVPEVVSLVFICVSEASLVVFFVSYAMIKFLRQFPGEMILNESVAFCLGYMFFLFRRLAGSSPEACKALAILVNYFLVAAFTWTALYSLEVVRALSFRPSASSPRRRRLPYYVVGWGAPLVPIILGIIADETMLSFKPSYGLPQCFIGTTLGKKLLFMAPLCICLLIDVIVYCYMVIKLAVIAKQTMIARDSRREKLWLCVKLIFSLGLLWIFAVVAAFSESEVMYCVFSLLDSLQGLFVMLIFVCKRRVTTSLKSFATSGTTGSTLTLDSRDV